MMPFFGFFIDLRQGRLIKRRMNSLHGSSLAPNMRLLKNSLSGVCSSQTIA
jgi:hypothetical protein